MRNVLDSSLELKVLVVDDNLGDFVLIEDYLLDKFDHIDVVHQSTYNEAINYLQNTEEKPSIILLDLNLNDIGGLELINGFLKYDFQIPIIILTGYANLKMAEDSLQLGISDYLLKDEINTILVHKSIVFALIRHRYTTEIETSNKKLKDIAWTQSHVVRAPLARMLGIVSMIEDTAVSGEQRSFFLEQLKVSANEMDDIVRNIVKETETIKFNR
jgi:CheY-like chemotaxis protein